MEAIDERVAWLQKHIKTTYIDKSVSAEWFKSVWNNENTHKCVDEFLNTEKRSFLMFHGDNMTACCVMPHKINKGNSVVFLKRKPIILTENINEEAFFLEVGQNPILHLEMLCETFLPIIANPLNQEGWGEVATKEIMDQVNGFVSNVSITVGRTRGQTILPLPKGLNSAFDMSRKHRVSILEGAIVSWTKQINSVLKWEPEQMLLRGQSPGPEKEIDFWQTKSSNLNGIFNQLQSDAVRKILRELDEQKSTYINTFARLSKKLLHARTEANDNKKYLWPLNKLFAKINHCEFSELKTTFRPILHTTLRIWMDSGHYNKPTRLVVLIQLVCNALIRQASKHINGPQIFQLIDSEEVGEAVSRLRQCLEMGKLFRSIYRETKARADKECPCNVWMTGNDPQTALPLDPAIFMRLDGCVERCYDLLDLTETIQQFGMLEKIEIGGTKGKQLTNTILQIYADFKETVEKLRPNEETGRTYDLMDIEAREFDDDFYEFRTRIKELERRLGSTITQAFDDISTIAGRFQLLDSFEGLLQRPVIADELEKKHVVQVHSYGSDLKVVQGIMQLVEKVHGQGAARGVTIDPSFAGFQPSVSNLPPIVAALYWCRGLSQRVSLPMTKLLRLNDSVLKREEATEVIALHSQMQKSMLEIEQSKFGEWKRSIDLVSQATLKLPLLKRKFDEHGRQLLEVNFDPKLKRLLREVKYFLLLDGEHLQVPESAMEIFKKVEIFRQQTGNLDLIVDMHNDIMGSLLPVEEPLVQSHLDKIVKTVSRGLTAMNWKSHGIDEFISDCMDVVTAANGVLKTLKNNMTQVETILAKMIEKPLIDVPQKPVTTQDFAETHKAHAKACKAMIKEGGGEILRLQKESCKVLKVDAGRADWRAYLDFVNSVVVDGLCRVVEVSTLVLAEAMNAALLQEQELRPFLEIQLDLVGDAVLFVPGVASDGIAMEEGEGDGLGDIGGSQSIDTLVDGWLDTFFQIGTLFRRTDNQGHYLQELHEDLGVQANLALLYDHLHESEVRLNKYKKKNFHKFSYLWTQSMTEHFAAFLEKAVTSMMSTSAQDHQKQEEGGAVQVATTDFSVPGNLCYRLLDLDMFDAHMAEYGDVQRQIHVLKTPVDLGWIRVNAQPVKQAMSIWVSKWAYQWTQFVFDDILGKLNELEELMVRVEHHIALEVVVEGSDPEVVDREALMEVMAVLRDVRKVEHPVMAMFGPLRDEVELLKKHEMGPQIADLKIGGTDLQTYLEEAPQKWEIMLRKRQDKEEAIIKYRQKEMDAVIQRKNQLSSEVSVMRSQYKTAAPFSHDLVSRALGDFSGVSTGGGEGEPAAQKKLIAKAYSILQTLEAELGTHRAKKIELRSLEDLFALEEGKYQEMEETAEEQQWLKKLWDFDSMLTFIFEAWQQTLWTEIDTEELEDRTKELAKQVKGLGAQRTGIRRWDLYKEIEARVKNMGVVLPLINELHSPAMRDRHWQTLSKECHAKAINPSEPRFCLEDLLELQLHKYVDNVSEIVEVAEKELKIERKLVSIEQMWVSNTLNFYAHKETEFMLMRPTEEVLDSLDQNQLELQAMLGMGKSVEHFRVAVLQWQRTLGQVETVLKQWVSVCKQWAALESIFLASADIRAQLPEDTKRFEGIDEEFKELMKDAYGDGSGTLVKEACMVEGMEEIFVDLHRRLALCQKSLNEYLDSKKKIFPRFYFVSTVALLEILSNGNNPPKIMPFLADCYDALSDLEFVEGSATKATTMIARDGERVKILPEAYEIEGAVEDWLNELTTRMRNSLKQHMHIAVEAAVHWLTEKPRHEWVFDYCAQVVLNTAQMWWTEELQMALEEFEGGSEDSMKNFLEDCNKQLEALIQLVLGKLTKEERTKTIALITMDVHGRDVVQKLITEKTAGPTEFLWQQQLRFYWKKESKDCTIRICDFETRYSYEYIGNTGRLVITPLTDRCYITLTMALRLYLGGAPAGPAGTGKTETTKDLARALALCCYVTNCSDQMNYQTMADIFRGLAQTGTWGCFDEFNRIPIEVLSVVATQVKTVLDAIVYLSVPHQRDDEYAQVEAGCPPCKVGTFEFMGDTISLIPTCGFWITMNPGYAGRTELPENLKALFRSCAMIRPDLKPICENMLMSEGFLTARKLAVKFVTLYQLSSELLSKQPHYDWGLRAVKSVLRVAGKLKRAEPDLDEAKILMRALRDFNTPKIPGHDLPIFLRLIADLFIGLEVEAKRDLALDERTKRVCAERGLQAEDGFVLKVAQYQELLDVRHSVMLLGCCGSAKSTIWRVLADTHNLKEGYAEFQPGECFRPKPLAVFEPVNPKSVTSNELYGYMTLAKDWKDGVLSIIMRGMSKNYAEAGFHSFQTSKWVVLDDDIDAVWIESMNTVMDDNKVLTLVSNERIPLSDAMRMVFEINSLANATPATVSRAGILYVNETDVGWRPYVDSWIARKSEKEQDVLHGLFDKVIDHLHDKMRTEFVSVTPLRLINKVTTLCHLIDGLLVDATARANAEEGSRVDSVLDNLDNQQTSLMLESMFAFAATWAFGGPLVVDKSANYRKRFHSLWVECFPFQRVKYPSAGMCFDYRFDTKTMTFEPWRDQVADYIHQPIGSDPGQVSFVSLVVPTVDSTRMSYLIDLLVPQPDARAVMLVGGAGTGKTRMLDTYLANRQQADERYIHSAIKMNYFTNSANIQQQLEQVIDKRSGKVFGPPATKKLVVFVDDLNLPYVEEYGTQNAISLLRQHMDYGTIFDRGDLGFRKEIVDVQYVAAMNPTAGSFTITERLQWQFSTFACMMPSNDDLTLIFGDILNGHLEMGFSREVLRVGHDLVQATVELLDLVLDKFLPSSTKFVYNWNMRELSNIFQGLTLALPEFCTSATDAVRLWHHECERVIGDRLITEPEINKFGQMIGAVVKKHFTASSQHDVKQEDVDARPLLFTSFMTESSQGEPAYTSVTEFAALRRVVSAKLVEYNESNPMMALVLFDQALEHITRIARIIQNPCGNAMLIGVGGSGKQSLSRLASFICGYERRQLQVTSAFTVADLKEALKEMYKVAGVKASPLLFIMTDTQVVDEQFLVYINDILATGWVPNLFQTDEIDGMLGSLRGEAKANGILDTHDEMLNFLIQRVRANLHIALCFSPVGDTFRVRARRFPGLINCTAIDWFHPWPREALVSVGVNFLADVALDSSEVRDNMANHMAFVHLTVTNASIEYKAKVGRYNYVTPKSFLELIAFYKLVLSEKQSHVQQLIGRLELGLTKLGETSANVAALQEDLNLKMADVAAQTEATNELLGQMGIERGDAERAQEGAKLDEEKASAAAEKAAVIQRQAMEELAVAKPAMVKSKEAVDCLDKAMLNELKALGKPPAGVDKVTKACLIMVEGEYRNHTWERARKMLNNVNRFLDRLKSVSGESFPDIVVTEVEKLMKDPEFTVDNMQAKSSAAANLCDWVRNIFTFNRIYVKVKPLMDSLEEAKALSSSAEKQCEGVRAEVAAIEARVQNLQDKFMAATETKARVEEEKNECLARLQLAQRLVQGLQSEKTRWAIEIERLKADESLLLGDVLLAAAFVSYIGSFDSAFRVHLWKDQWARDLQDRGLPSSADRAADGAVSDPLSMLMDDSSQAKMMQEGLPADRISVENGAIIVNSKRWPLLIDPQLQGIKWLKKREENAEGGLVNMQLSQGDWLAKLQLAISSGSTVIISNLGESIDASLEPVLARAVYIKNKKPKIKLGGEEFDYDMRFRLHLQTKLPNPHYNPETFAQCTIVNFIATEAGLEEQLLAKAVDHEQPELEARKQLLVKQFQEYQIQLTQLEDDLLYR
jgi:dynein heavy chain